MKIRPNELYPTESISSISEDTIRYFLKCYKDQVPVDPIYVYKLANHYYIVEGHHRMLAANRLGLAMIDVEYTTLNTGVWRNDEEVKQLLLAVGVNTLYDFEALGGFTYSDYPEFYKSGRNQ